MLVVILSGQHRLYRRSRDNENDGGQWQQEIPFHLVHPGQGLTT
jgi:hypothetical protein